MDTLPADVLRKLGDVAPAFKNVPNRLFVSGRSLKHTGEQRPEWIPRFQEVLTKLIREPDRILPNPTAGDPWARPWLVKKIDRNMAVLVEVRANGKGIDVMNIIGPIDNSRVNKAVRLLEQLGKVPSDFEFGGPQAQ